MPRIAPPRRRRSYILLLVILSLALTGALGWLTFGSASAAFNGKDNRFSANSIGESLTRLANNSAIAKYFGGLNLLAANAQQGCTPPSGLVAWLPGDGNTNDISGNNNNGTPQGNVSYVAGKVAQAFNLNGTDADVKVPASASLNVGAGNGLTIDAWINPVDISQERPLVEWNNNAGNSGTHFWISVTSQGGVAGNLYANLVDTNGLNHIIQSPTAIITANAYQHVAVTYDKTSGVATLYHNGVIVAQQNLGVFTPQTTYDLYFGLRPSGTGAGARYTGALDEVDIFDHALSQTEIQAIVNADSAGKCKSYDAVNNFSINQNPNGVWSYGYSAGRGATFNLDTNSTPGQSIESWSAGSNGPYVYHNKSGTTQTYASITQPPDLLNLDPSFSQQNSIVRWTAPAAGNYRISGRFQGIDSTTTDVAVLKNHTTTNTTTNTTTITTTELFSGAVNGFGAQQPFSLIVSVVGGDTIDFSVGIGTNGYTNDSTGLAASITPAQAPTPTPTPAPTADLSLSITDSPDPVAAGNNVTYTIPVTNNGSATATNVQLSDTLPANTTFVSATSTQGTCIRGDAANSVLCSIGTLSSGATATATIIVRPTTAGTITNTASVTATESDPNIANNSASASTVVNPSKVALFVADYPEWTIDVQNKIRSTGFFSQVDLFDVRSSTPTLAQLQQYNAVFVYSDFGFSDRVALGNVLADYMDSGGGVVLATFAYTDNAGYGIEGRIKTAGYLPFTTSSNTAGTRLSLVKDQPDHPILNGVASFNGGSSSYHNSPITTTTGTTLVAHWTNNQPLVGTKQPTRGRIVGLNFFPPSSDIRSDFWQASTNGARLMGNSLLFAAGQSTFNATIDLALTKSHTGNFTVGTNGTYTLTVSNVGNASSTGTTTVTDTLPNGLTYVSATGTDWSCTASGQTVTCTNSSQLAGGASSSIALTVAVSNAASPGVTNTASVSNAGDSNAANNTASDQTTVTTPTYAISGTVTDAIGNRLSGVSVRANSTSHEGTATTNNDGFYTITNLAAGDTYNVTPSQANYTFNPSGRTITLNSNATNIDFARNPIISGRVTDSNGAGIPDVTVAAYSPSYSGVYDAATTASDGTYSLTSLISGGTYKIDPSKIGLSFTPQLLTYNNLSSDQTGADFTGRPVTGLSGKISFTSGDGECECNDIFIINADGSNRINLTRNSSANSYGSSQQAKWSPDGTRLVFRRFSSASGLYIITADGSNPTLLTNNGSDASPAWSPDGTKIAFTRNVSNGQSKIFVINADGSGTATDLTGAATTNESSPTWSADGTKIAYSYAANSFSSDTNSSTSSNSNTSSTSGIGVMNAADGSAQTVLTTDGGSQPDWSPDNTRIAYQITVSSYQSSSSAIIVMNADGTNPTNITQNYPGFLSSPSWSPDDTRLVVEGSQGLFAIKVDGTEHTRITNGFANYPAWQRLQFTIAGQVTNSANASPLSGATVTLSGLQNRTAITDASGSYSFAVNAGGNYAVTPSKSNYTFSPSSTSFNNLGGDQSANFAGTSTLPAPTPVPTPTPTPTPVPTPIPTYTISGRALDGGANGIEDVTVTLSAHKQARRQPTVLAATTRLPISRRAATTR